MRERYPARLASSLTVGEPEWSRGNLSAFFFGTVEMKSALLRQSSTPGWNLQCPRCQKTWIGACVTFGAVWR